MLDGAAWKSKLSLNESVIPRIDGGIRIRFKPDTDRKSLVGTSFDLFDWPAPVEISNRFVKVDLPPGSWDLRQLYHTGEISFEALPRPGDADGNGRFD